MALKDLMMILVALALPIWLMVEQVMWWASSKERQAEIEGLDVWAVEATRRRKATSRPARGPMLPQVPRRVA